MRSLIVEVDVGAQHLDDVALVRPCQEEHVIDLDPPRAQRVDRPFVGRDAARGDHGHPQHPRIRRGLPFTSLQGRETGEETLQRTRVVRHRHVIRFEMLKSGKATCGKLRFRLVICEHPVEIERHPQTVVAVVNAGRLQHLPGGHPGVDGGAHAGLVAAEEQ